MPWQGSLRIALLALALALSAAAPAAAQSEDGPRDQFDEVIPAGEGDDETAGGRGGDLIVDLAGDDVIRGGAGDDRISVRDLVGGDRVSCGDGEDLVIADRNDRVAGDCERTLGPGRTRVRRDAAALDSAARERFVDAVLELKRTQSPYSRKLGWYDQFVDWHEDAFGREEWGAHGGPGFLPWHRAFLLTFEDALTLVAGEQVALPYWDWTRQPSTDAVFSEDLVGPSGDPEEQYAVTEGPFRKGRWRLRVRDEAGTETFAPELPQPEEGPYIERNLGGFPNSGLPDRATVRAVLGVGRYDRPDWTAGVDAARSFRQALEGGRLANQSGSHNTVHMWTAGSFRKDDEDQIGTMGLGTSPNDPVFWLHHTQIDRVWEAWLSANPRAYRPVNKGPRAQRRDATLRPFARHGIQFTPKRLLHPRRLGFRYADLPAAARQSSDLAAGGRDWLKCTLPAS